MSERASAIDYGKTLRLDCEQKKTPPGRGFDKSYRVTQNSANKEEAWVARSRILAKALMAWQMD